MVQKFTANYKKSGRWYLGWVEEVPGVNTQGKTLSEVKNNLKEALALVMEVNRSMIKKEIAKGGIVREQITYRV